MVRTVLIDDEKASICVLTSLFEEYFHFVEVVGNATSVKEGKKEILKHKPDLVFLDIEMGDGTGFDLLESISVTDFKVVFITAYSEYALKAIKKRAFDYLLKPIDVDELRDTLSQIKTELQQNEMHTTKYPSKLNIPYKNGSLYIEVNKISRIEAQGSYCKIYTTDKEEYIVSNNLKHFENKLNPNQFFRCHHSHLINLSKVERIINEMGMIAVLNDGTHVDISKRKKCEFHRSMGLSLE